MDDVIEFLSSFINKTVFKWTSKFYYHVDFMQHLNNNYEFTVEFSAPTKLLPVPKAKVKVFFTCKELPDGDFDITFRFENQSLVHKLNDSIRCSQIEKWIERILKEKEITRDVLFLGTEFEAERIKNDQMDVIFQEAVMNPVALELRKLNESLLSSSIDYTKTESSIDDRTLDLLKNTMFEFFRTFDKNDMGVVSFQECKEVLKAMEVELSEKEISDLMLMADKNNNGMIEYKEFIPLGAEVLYGLLLKQQTDKELGLEEDMVINQAVMILYNDEIHDLSQIIVKDCKEIDEDQEGVIPTAEIYEIFKKHSGVLNEREYEILYKNIEEEYPEKFVYGEIPNIFFRYKVDVIKNGLSENNVTKLEQYLRELFKIFDTEKTGKLSAHTVMEALSKAEKIMLTQMQLYILRSFVKKDEQGNVDYNKEARFLAEMVKKFFNPSLIKKQAQFMEKGFISPDTYMEGWTKEAMIDQINEIFQEFDVDKNKLLDKEEYKKLLQQAGINLSDEEIYALMIEADTNGDGFVDFNEFQSHFYTILRLIRRNKALYTIIDMA